MANRKQKEEEKTSKYAPLRWEIRQQYPHYKIAQYNVIVDVLWGQSRKTLDSIKDFVGVRADKILLDMQKAVISSTLNIAQSFKVLTAQNLWTGQTFTHNFLGVSNIISRSISDWEPFIFLMFPPQKNIIFSMEHIFVGLPFPYWHIYWWHHVGENLNGVPSVNHWMSCGCCVDNCSPCLIFYSFCFT